MASFTCHRHTLVLVALLGAMVALAMGLATPPLPGVHAARAIAHRAIPVPLAVVPIPLIAALSSAQKQVDVCLPTYPDHLC